MVQRNKALESAEAMCVSVMSSVLQDSKSMWVEKAEAQAETGTAILYSPAQEHLVFHFRIW